MKWFIILPLILTSCSQQQVKSAADKEKCRLEVDARAISRAIIQCDGAESYQACPAYEELEAQAEEEMLECR